MMDSVLYQTKIYESRFIKSDKIITRGRAMSGQEREALAGKQPRVSSCCSAVVCVNSADEGTAYHVCTACGKPCDAVEQPQEDERNEFGTTLEERMAIRETSARIDDGDGFFQPPPINVAAVRVHEDTPLSARAWAVVEGKAREAAIDAAAEASWRCGATEYAPWALLTEGQREMVREEWAAGLDAFEAAVPVEREHEDTDADRPTLRQHEELQISYQEALGRATRAEKASRNAEPTGAEVERLRGRVAELGHLAEARLREKDRHRREKLQLEEAIARYAEDVAFVTGYRVQPRDEFPLAQAAVPPLADAVREIDKPRSITLTAQELDELRSGRGSVARDGVHVYFD